VITSANLFTGKRFHVNAFRVLKSASNDWGCVALSRNRFP